MLKPAQLHDPLSTLKELRSEKMKAVVSRNSPFVFTDEQMSNAQTSHSSPIKTGPEISDKDTIEYDKEIDPQKPLVTAKVLNSSPELPKSSRPSLLTRLGFRSRCAFETSPFHSPVTHTLKKRRMDHSASTVFAYAATSLYTNEVTDKDVCDAKLAAHLSIVNQATSHIAFETIDWLTIRDKDLIRETAEHFGINGSKSVPLQFLRKKLNEIQRYLSSENVESM
eukprot:Gregarina_sp_Poly_1__1705@NODE_143_length_12919_cov_90_642857_g128_i0_p5_GENE_NODE_143_length_12919_cov_90_642857_g128_i0NODE_143_length_12919_cov_90_642857_g128_i0_p5_ORF_typecomplete_len224_score23_24_NODE_143_length_12919_cov_90_642857_g128_i017502421